MHEPAGPAGHLKRIELLEQAVAKDPNFARAYVQLAEAYRWPGGCPGLTLGDWKKAGRQQSKQ